jgi:CRP/FNR family transcriptional regulator
VENRIAYVLLTLAQRACEPEAGGLRITIPLSREDIARMAGTVPEMTIRIISRWTRAGRIRTERGGYIRIWGLDALQELAHSDR